MKRRIYAAIAVTVLIVVLVILASCGVKAKWPPKKVFGELIKPGDFYEYIYSEEPEVYHEINRNDGPNAIPLFEDFIDSMVLRMETGFLFAEKVYKQYGQNYTQRGYEDMMRGMMQDYDLKMVNAVKTSSRTQIQFKLYIKGDSWCIVDAADELIACGENHYGAALKAIIDEMNTRSAVGHVTHRAPAAGITPLENQ